MRGMRVACNTLCRAHLRVTERRRGEGALFCVITLTLCAEPDTPSGCEARKCVVVCHDIYIACRA